jgi:hypothetical protein
MENTLQQIVQKMVKIIQAIRFIEVVRYNSWEEGHTSV